MRFKIYSLKIIKKLVMYENSLAEKCFKYKQIVSRNKNNK